LNLISVILIIGIGSYAIVFSVIANERKQISFLINYAFVLL